jgi:ribosomal protein S11
LAIDSLLTESYTGFVKDVEPRLRQALVARFGPEEGREATAEALAYGWEHWKRLQQMTPVKSSGCVRVAAGRRP